MSGSATATVVYGVLISTYHFSSIRRRLNNPELLNDTAKRSAKRAKTDDAKEQEQQPMVIKRDKGGLFGSDDSDLDSFSEPGDLTDKAGDADDDSDEDENGSDDDDSDEDENGELKCVEEQSKSVISKILGVEDHGLVFRVHQGWEGCELEIDYRALFVLQLDDRHCTSVSTGTKVNAAEGTRLEFPIFTDKQQVDKNIRQVLEVFDYSSPPDSIGWHLLLTHKISFD